MRVYFHHFAASLTDKFNYECDYDENTAADVVDHFASYAHPSNVWHARSRTPTQAQYDHLMAGIRRAVQAGESFRAHYCGELIKIVACKLPACGLAFAH